MATAMAGVQLVAPAALWWFWVLLLHTCRSHAGVYKVGDKAGWTTLGNVDYKQWSATKTFRVGDVILFEYSPQFHNVMHVTHPAWKSCNTSSPIATYTTGNDSITITNHGHHFFFCGVPGHCQAGQKVDIHVLRLSSSMPPSHSVSSSHDKPSAMAPAPSTSDATVGLNPLKSCLLGLVVALGITYS